MRGLLIGFLLLIFIILILALPFKVKVKMHVNLINPQAYYSIKVAFLKLICGKAYIQSNKFIVQNTHNIFKTEGKMSKKEACIIKQIIKNINITRAEIYFTGGIKDDAYQTAMLCGNMYAISSAITAYLITNNNFINIYQDIDTDFNNDALDLSVSAIVELSILDIIFAVIIGSNKVKEKENGKI